MADTLRGKAAIVGVADLASPTGELDLHGRALEIAMIKAALDDAGLSLGDVDGVCHAQSSMVLAEYLRITPRWTESTMTGGSVVRGARRARGRRDRRRPVRRRGERLREHATIRSQARRQGEGRARRPGGGGGNDAAVEFEVPYGLRAPIAPYALAANRHMHEYGTTAEQLAAIAVQTRRWASMNPQARYREPITVDDVLASPYQVAPLHTLDCCLVTDGAGAFVMTSAERAKSLRKPPVYVLGAATAHDHASAIAEMPDLTTTPGAISGPNAFRMAGVAPADVDVLEGYDSFTITALLHLEDLGFCAKGEGGPFAAEGHTGTGRLDPDEHARRRPLVHPPRHVRDVPAHRGDQAAPRRVRRTSGRRTQTIAVAHGAGFILSCMSTIVLGTEATL